MEDKMKTQNIGGRLFKTSSHSLDDPFSKCVSVSISKKDVLVKHFYKNDQILQFTRDEWDAFIKGVKNDEFELEIG